MSYDLTRLRPFLGTILVKQAGHDSKLRYGVYLCEPSHEGAVTVATAVDPHGELHAPADVFFVHHQHADVCQ